jgi:SAM-dependent methyltransferase
MRQPSHSIDRTGLFERLDQNEIVRRYRRVYKLGDDIGPAEVERHAALEGALTDELLASAADERFDVFARAYSRLYDELPWLVSSGTSSGGEVWLSLLRPGASVYEIGSGSGYLINFLASKGLRCVGTDMSPQRRHAAQESHGNIRWDITDGVHLTRFAEAGAFDYVISDQVVEHMHPDDLPTHFAEARKLLKAGGEYIVRTPYWPLGPTDLSQVFGCDRAIFMHLHEFGFEETLSLAKDAGFRDIKAIYVAPKTTMAMRSSAYAAYLKAMDRLIATDRPGGIARFVKKHARYFMIRNNVFLSLKA